MSLTGKPQRIAEVFVDSLSTKRGNGVGFFLSADDQKSRVDVPFTLPGERVKASLMQKRSGMYRSRLEEVLSSSSDRIPPRCLHFTACGGCRWQHIPYLMQLSQKELFIRQAFAPILTEQTRIEPIIPCNPPWNYRNKMEFSFSQDRKKEHFLGLIIDASQGKVFNLTECHLVHPWMVEGVKAVREWWKKSELEAYHLFKDQGSLRTLTLREGFYTGDRLAMLTVSGNPEFALKKRDLESLKAYLREAIEPQNEAGCLSIFLRIQQIAKGRPTEFYEMLLYGPDHIRECLTITYDPSKDPLTLSFSISPSAFFQPNTRQAEKLYSAALQMANIPPHAIVYDLYCGTGTLAICAAQCAKQVFGVEISPESSLDARTNVKANGLEQITILTGAVASILEQRARDNAFPLPDVVMVDPPRAGLEAAGIKEVAALKAAKLLYISCNPATQAADVQMLIQHGYRLTAMQAVDQFPQTAHIENIVLLEK